MWSCACASYFEVLDSLQVLLFLPRESLVYVCGSRAAPVVHVTHTGASIVLVLWFERRTRLNGLPVEGPAGLGQDGGRGTAEGACRARSVWSFGP